MRLTGTALLAAPLALMACAQAGAPPEVPEPAAEVAVDHGPQERSCAGTAAAQLGLGVNEVTAVWESEADRRAVVNVVAGGVAYRCVVDESLNVLNLQPVA